ncbi:MAG: hypothetical protein DRO93_03450 [Candidatus Thorarchaeota archaeon]|nr:MAG: hypothetical protein DRO93_03450 [Candidatus Thorarchaeota archaeon]
MGFVVVTYLAWLLYNPINFVAETPLGQVPPLPVLVVDTVVFAPLMYLFVREWLRRMTQRKGGPAAGIDVVEPGEAEPEPGDELGTATRSYSESLRSKIAGPKSDIRETPALERDFFVKVPDLESGKALFDVEQLRARAMIRSRVSSGGWIRKRVASRGSGTLKASESTKQGRPFRSRMPSGEVSSIDVPTTVLAAIARTGKKQRGRPLKIAWQDIREKVFTARTPLTVILVIDVSLSMRAHMSDVRKVVERIERETRGSRDRVGIVAFKDSGAVEVQAPTSNWNKIYRALARLRLSGLTPLADGIMKAMETLKREKMRNPDVESLIVVISDFSPNIPLAQSVGPGHAQYTPVRDLVRAARLAKKQKTRLVAVNVNSDERNWVRVFKLPYHDALELASTLRMKKEGLHDVIETILAVPTFRRTFGAFLVARICGGRAFLTHEILRVDSVLGAFLAACRTRSRLSPKELKRAEAYLS